MRKILVSLALLAWLAACGYVDAYEAGVYDYQPTYCYRSIGAVRCFKTPKHSEERRLVNYYGPHPSRYDKPAPRPAPEFRAPPPVAFYVRDPEPVPEAAPLSAHLRSDAAAGKAAGERQTAAADAAPAVATASEAPPPEAAPVIPVTEVEADSQFTGP